MTKTGLTHKISDSRDDRQRFLLPIKGLLQGLSRSRPHQAYTPRINGKAERFPDRARGMAYAQAYDTSALRAAELPFWLHR
jgi:hypothetical protein